MNRCLTLSYSVTPCRTQPPSRFVYRTSQADPPERKLRCQTWAGERHGAQPQAGSQSERCVFCFWQRALVDHQTTLLPACVQEQELLARISDLQAEVCSRNNRITDLDHEIHSLNETIDTLTRELEHKGKEVLRVRSEANQQIRYGTGQFWSGPMIKTTEGTFLFFFSNRYCLWLWLIIYKDPQNTFCFHIRQHLYAASPHILCSSHWKISFLIILQLSVQVAAVLIV